MRAAQVRHERDAHKERREFFNTLNAFGSVMAGKKWRWQTPRHEAEEVDDFEEREDRALRRLAEKRQRRAEA